MRYRPLFIILKTRMETAALPSLTCLCVHLPDVADAPYYLQQLVTRRQQVAHLYEGRTAKGLAVLPRLTYPALRCPLAVDPALVYVAWKGALRWAHRPAERARLEPGHLSNMDELLATRMLVGGDYLWVFSEPIKVPSYPVPPAALYGRVSQSPHLQDRPSWLHLTQ